jgi:hypothetical protein
MNTLVKQIIIANSRAFDKDRFRFSAPFRLALYMKTFLFLARRLSLQVSSPIVFLDNS